MRNNDIVGTQNLKQNQADPFLAQKIVILDAHFSFLRMDKTKWDEQ